MGPNEARKHTRFGLTLKTVANPSVNLSPNGRPSGPSHNAVRSILWLVPGVLPLSLTYLER
jgi:hypothetical protein